MSNPATLLLKAARKLDANPTLCLILLIASALPYLLIKATVSHLTCDEVYTFRIAQQPTLHQLLTTSQRIDLHPPLHYLAERAALATHLPQLLAARLPSILATLGTLIFLALFCSSSISMERHPEPKAKDLCISGPPQTSSVLPGLFAATLFFFSPAMNYAWSNRPYALWLFLLALSAYLWKRAANSPNILWSIALFFAVLAMVADYMSGLACILPLFLAELHRTRRHTFQPRIWIALGLPCIAGFAYLHQVRTFATNGFAPRYLDVFSTAQDMYTALALLPLAIAAACAIAAHIFTTPSPNGASSRAQPRDRSISPAEANTLHPEDLTLGLSLTLLPALLALIASLHHAQFFARYGACAAIGLAITLTFLTERFSSNFRLTATFAAIALVITGIVQANNAPFVFEGSWRAARPTGVAPQHLDQLPANIPLVIASPTGYTEMTQREPDTLLAHTFYLTDRTSALRYSGSTVFEDMATTSKLLDYHSQTEALTPFLAEHKTFYLVADYIEPEEWLPRALIDHGAHLQYLGKFVSVYQDEDLYLVTQ